MLLLPAEAREASTAAVYEAFDDAAARRLRRAAGRAPCGAVAGRATSPRSRRTTSRPRRSPSELATLGAFRADVTGAGPAVYGLFADRADAEAARRALWRRGRTWLTAPAWYG